MMKRFVLSLLLCGMALGLSGCFHHKYTDGSARAGGVPDYDQWRHHLIGGLVTLDENMDLRAICPSGVAYIHDRQTFLNGLVGAITFGIYTPTQVTIYCKSGRAAAEGQGEEIAMLIDAEFVAALEGANPEVREWAEAVASGEIAIDDVDNGKPLMIARKVTAE